MQRWPELIARLGDDALAGGQAEADRVIAAALAGHLVSRGAGEDERPDAPWRLDPIPLVLEDVEFEWLAAAVRQRMEAMEVLLGDLYGARRCVREGWVPGEVLAASPRYRLAMVGAPTPPRWLTSYALDVVVGADGAWRAVQDLADTPTGIGYAQLDRSVMARVATELLGPDGVGEPASIGGFPAELRHALATVSAVESPRIVLLTSGIADPAYVEHSALAGLLGFHLVHGADLVVRSGRVWLRVLGGVEPIDVVYRRRADVELDPIEVSATAATGVPGLAFAAAEGGVVLANAHGAGVLEDPAVAPYWAQAIAGLTGEALLLPSLDGALPPLAMRPAFLDGRVDAAPVVVRLHAVAGPDGPRVMPGGNGRVLAPGDHPRRPTARVAKDVWVLGVRPTVRLAPPLPQVDLAASVTTRVADAMYWLGRSAERAEAIARTAWAVKARDEEDPALAELDGGRWAVRMVGLLRGVSGGPSMAASDGAADLDRARADAWAALVSRLGDVVEAAATVGEHLSTTTGRVLRRLAAARDLGEHAPIDVLDAVLTDLAALAGLWNESVVRGPAWRVGELGRRIERSLVVLTLVAASTDGAPAFDPTDLVATAGLEVTLAANESLVAYRRRYRSDVELPPAAALLLLDGDNPRSFAAAVARMTEHVDALDWPAGREALEELARTVRADRPLAGVPAALQRVRAFDELVGRHWFATPVEPVLVRAGGTAPGGR